MKQPGYAERSELPRRIASFGWSLEQLTGQDVALPQKIGRAAEFLEVCALLVPSARAVTTNGVLLMKNHSIADIVEVVSSITLDPPEALP